MADRTKVEEQLQQKIVEYKTKEQLANSMSNQKDMFEAKLLEVQGTLHAMEQMAHGDSEMIFPIGSGSYIKGKRIDGNTVLVEIGANVALNMSISDANSYIESRKKELENGMGSLDTDIKRTISEMRDIEFDAQKIMADAQREDSKFKVVSS